VKNELLFLFMGANIQTYF